MAKKERLTALILRGYYKQLKGLDKENLRDHMTNIELIFTMLGEESTRIIAVKDDAQGFEENHDAARRGGSVAKNARMRLEKESGEKVVSPKIFLEKPSEETLPDATDNKDS